MTGRAAAALIGACLAAGVLAGFALHSMRRTPAVVFPRPSRALTGDAVWPAGRRPAPGFALRDQRGRLVSLAGQRGHPVVLTFMDSRCKLICTLQGPQIASILRATGIRGARLLVVSVNPWEDTAASSAAAGARYGFGGDWHWLRGSPAALRPVWRAYAIDVIRTSGDVTHGTALYLIDRHGYERAGFNFPFPQRQVVRDLRALA